MEDDVNPGVYLRAQDVSQKAEVLLERIELLYQSLPVMSRNRIRERIRERTTAFTCRIPLQDVTWKVSADFSLDPRILILLEKKGKSLNITKKSELYNALANEPDGPELLDFISNALSRLGEAFDEAFQAETEQLDPDVAELSKALKDAREKVQLFWKEKTRLEHEGVALKLAIQRSIPELQKATQDLRNTRTFLGQSKTIKGIRENIEKVINALWEVAYSGEPLPLNRYIETEGPASPPPRHTIPGPKVIITRW